MSIIPPHLSGVKVALTPLIAEGLFFQIALAANGYSLKKEVDW
jgi:hypothetical protein